MEDGAWVRVKNAWLLARAEPKSKEELDSWGADAVAYLLTKSSQAEAIEKEAVSAGKLKVLGVFPVQPTCTRDYIYNDCWQMGRFVAWADAQLTRGNKVVVHCRQGQHRTGVAIYLLLRYIYGDWKERCFSIMRDMRPLMLSELRRVTTHRHLVDKAESIFADSRFRNALSVAQRLHQPGQAASMVIGRKRARAVAAGD